MRYTEDEEPIVVKGKVPMPPNFVAPLAKREPVTVDAPAWMVQREPMNLAAGWQTLEGAQEHTSAMDRAQALQVRMVPWLWSWGIVGVIVGLSLWWISKTPELVLAGALSFAGLTAFTYYKMNGQDYAHSREGTERHKVDVAADLAREQMRHEQELRRMAWQFQVKQLEDRER